MHRPRSTKRPANLSGGQETGRHDKLIKEIINDYESQLKLDAGMQKLWFKRVLTRNETLELIRFYCSRIGQYKNVGDPGVYHELLTDMKRILFLAQTMNPEK